MEPNLKCFTKAEEEEVFNKAMALYEKGKEEEGDALLYSLPMPAEYLQILKEEIGLEALVREGVNLSTAVEKYGESWLVS